MVRRAKKEDFVTHENYIKFAFQCPKVTFCSNAIMVPASVILAVLLPQRQMGGVLAEIIRPSKPNIFITWLFIN